MYSAAETWLSKGSLDNSSFLLIRIPSKVVRQCPSEERVVYSFTFPDEIICLNTGYNFSIVQESCARISESFSFFDSGAEMPANFLSGKGKFHSQDCFLICR